MQMKGWKARELWSGRGLWGACGLWTALALGMAPAALAQPATKADLAAMQAALRGEMRTEFRVMRAERQAEHAEMRAEHAEMRAEHTEIRAEFRAQIGKEINRLIMWGIGVVAGLNVALVMLVVAVVQRSAAMPPIRSSPSKSEPAQQRAGGAGARSGSGKGAAFSR